MTIDNTLTHPQTSPDGRGLIPVDNGNVWYTPFYFRTEWHVRRLVETMRRFFPGTAAPAPESAPESAPAPRPELPPAPPEKPSPAPMIELSVNDAGQYTLF